MSKEEIIRKIRGSSFKEGSFANRVCNLVLDGEFEEPLTSQQFVELYNDGPEKNIKSSDLGALMGPLMKKGIVKTKSCSKGKGKTKFWFPGWVDSKKEFAKDKIQEPLNGLHPEIKKVSENLFRDGHYSQAIEEAFKRIVNLVKKKSGVSEPDGSPLMTTVFSKRNPYL